MKTLFYLTVVLCLLSTPAIADHWHGGGGIVGGVETGIGLGVGQAITGGLINWFFGPKPEPQQSVLVPNSPNWYAYCANKYRSFNPQTGTYLGYDGMYHACQ